MQFVDESLLSAIESHYQEPINAIRIKKEFEQLSKYNNANVVLRNIQLNSLALKFFVECSKPKQNKHTFEVRIDKEYPFHRPQIFYLDSHTNVYEGADLFEYQLNEGEIWGPSQRLIDLFDRIPVILSKIENSIKKIGKFYKSDCYTEKEILSRGFKMFKVHEIIWNFFVNSTQQKLIAVSNSTLLKFDIANDHIVLQNWVVLSEITEVNPNFQKSELVIKYRHENQIELMHLSNIEDVQRLKLLLRPVETILKRVKQNEANNQNRQTLIHDYKYLISYFANNDSESHGLYQRKLKNLMNKQNLIFQDL